jgi:hypothetical protein
MEDYARGIERIIREDAELQGRIEAEAKATAHALIQGYLGPDHKVITMSDFYSALVQALKAAREKGRMDGQSGSVSDLT